MPQLASTLSSLLMALPLIAVPCLAIWGLPTSKDASAEKEELGIELGIPSTLGDESTHAHDHAESDDSSIGSLGEADTLSTANAEQVTANAGGDRSHIAPTSGHHGAAANAAVGLGAKQPQQEQHADHGHGLHDHAHHDHGEHDRHADDKPSSLFDEKNPFLAQNSKVSQPNKTSEFSTLNSQLKNPQPNTPALQTALGELRSLGIKNCRLTNSDIPGEFFFCCSLRTSRNILQRFEAEAATPVAAARDVIAQVKSWQSTR